MKNIDKGKIIIAILCSLFLFSSMNAFALTDSTTKAIIVTTTPNDYFVLEKGWIKWPGANSINQSFNTSKHCPAKFKPYIDLEFQRITHPGSSTVNNGFTRNFGVCVNKVTDNTSSYNVKFLSIKNFADVTEQKSEMRGHDDYRRPMYGSYNEGKWVVTCCEDTTRRFAFHEIYVPGNPSYQLIGGLDWTLYCYPEGLSRPYDQESNGDAGCESSIAPFKDGGPNT